MADQWPLFDHIKQNGGNYVNITVISDFSSSSTGDPNIHTTLHFKFNTQNRQQSKQLQYLNPWAFTPSEKKERKKDRNQFI